MPTSVFPSVSSFDNKDTVVIKEKSSDAIDFGQCMADAVDVQEIDTNLYMSKELWRPVGARGAFGGQIVAQALKAAFNTVSLEFHVHSLHSYFILPGNVDYPVIYSVQCVRDGRSFVTRFVTASQRGKAIFICSFSFTKDDDSVKIEHQVPMPDVVGPESLPSYTERQQQILEHDLPPRYRQFVEASIAETSPIDYRDLHINTPLETLTGVIKATDVNRRWFKTKGSLGDDPRLHACVIAYASDNGFVMTAAYANGVSHRGIGMIASLDHSMWFHAPAKADDWLFYDMQSPRSSEGRGVCFGRIYTRDGTLVATTAQEGLIRLSKREQAKRQPTNNSKL